MSGHAQAELILGPNASLERRIQVLEDNHRRLRTEIDRRFREVETTATQLRQQVDRERAERATAVAVIAERWEKFAIGGFDMEVVALLWLLLGTVATCIPRDVLWLFGL